MDGRMGFLFWIEVQDILSTLYRRLVVRLNEVWG